MAGNSTARSAAAKAAPAAPQLEAGSAQPTAAKPTIGRLSDAASLTANADLAHPVLNTNVAGAKKQLQSVQMQRAALPPAHWRITSDGHLERFLTPGNWTGVLGEQPVSFRAVAVVGDQVWAGGSDGALFHSIDGGNQWTKIALDANGQPERGAVNSIQFDTVSQGRVTIDSGTIWKTGDSGQTWSKQ